MAKVGWGIWGLGTQAEVMAEAIAASCLGTLAAVGSNDGSRAKAIADRFGAKQWHASYGELLDDKDVMAVCITSPNDQHARQTIAALRAGKHVLSEKPLALSALEGKAIANAAKKYRRQVGVGYHLRHHPAFAAAKEHIAAGTLGDLIFIDAAWSVGKIGEAKFPPLPAHKAWREDPRRSGGGAMMARGVHLLDLLRFVTGLDITSVTAATDQRDCTSVEQFAMGLLRLNQTPATMLTSRRLPLANNHLTIYGTGGKLTLRDSFTTNSVGELEILGKKKQTRHFRRPANVYTEEADDFVRWIAGKPTNTATLEDGLHAIAATEAFFKSAKEKRMIRMPSIIK